MNIQIAKKHMFPKSFFEKTWPKTLVGGESKIEVTGNESPEQLAEKMYEDLKPSLDAYIKKYNLPVEKLPNESDEAFFTRVVKTMYDLNEKNREHKGWMDCWPSTALEVGRTNCALGSLVVARVLEKAGYVDDVHYGFPGPMTHAVIITKGKYLDPANGVVLDVVEDKKKVDGISTYWVIEIADAEIMEKVPFRRIPVTTVEQGVAPLVTNMGSMIHRGDKRGDKTAEELIERFNLDRSNPYGNLGRDNLLGENWNLRRIFNQEEWQQEKKEVDARFAE